MPEIRTDGGVDVLICGAGPNGLMLAGELALAGVRPLVIESLPGPSAEPRANGLVGQVVRFLDMRGLYADLAGMPGPPKPAPAYIFSGLPLTLTDLSTNPLYGIMIPQPTLTRRLYERARRLGVGVRWENRLIDLTRHDDRVQVTIGGPQGDYRINARFLVGADGGKSVVRKQAGIGFPGCTSTAVTRMGHVSLPDELRADDGSIDIPGAGRFGFGHNRLERGMFVFAELEPGRPIVAVEEYDGAEPCDGPMTLYELRAGLRRVLGTDLPIEPPAGPGPHALRRISGQNTRLADRYREGPVFLLGDAAHVHSGIGGPGLNLGLQDAANLGWKLGGQLAGWAPPELLDTYQSERHPAGERVMMSSLAQTGLMLPGPEVTALRQLVGELLDTPATTEHIANLMAGSDVRYDTGDTHPLAGRMVPEATISDGDDTRRVADLLHTARPVLLDLTGEQRFGAVVDRWSDRVGTIAGKSTDLPAEAILIRPDGYVAWATERRTGATDDDLRNALTRWFGAPKP